jgi:cytochrome b
MSTVRVWDLPIRFFHWLLVISIVSLYVTAQLGGNWMEWHVRFGYFTLGLVTFRIVWGCIGSHHARFVNFVRGPGAVIGYLKGLIKNDAPHFLGHNPMGALSVIALLGSVLFQAVTGLFSNDDILLEGPYVSMVSKSTSDFLTKLHHLNSDLMLILIGVHLAAIAFYFFKKKENLVKAMLSGDKPVDDNEGLGEAVVAKAVLAIGSNSPIGAEFEASAEPNLDVQTSVQPSANLPSESGRAVSFWVTAVTVAALTYAVVTKVFW